MRLAIEDALDDGLPRAYSKEIYEMPFSSTCMRVTREGEQLYANLA